MNTQTTIKIWTDTRKQLRMLHAYTGESMVAIIARLVGAELARVRKEEETTKIPG